MEIENPVTEEGKFRFRTNCDELGGEFTEEDDFSECKIGDIRLRLFDSGKGQLKVSSMKGHELPIGSGVVEEVEEIEFEEGGGRGRDIFRLKGDGSEVGISTSNISEEEISRERKLEQYEFAE